MFRIHALSLAFFLGKFFLKSENFWLQAREKIIRKINRMIVVYRQNGSMEVSNGVLGRLLEEESLPDEAVADFIINLLFAGNETTAKTMLFAVYFLTHCPKSLNQLLVLIIYIIYQLRCRFEKSFLY